MLISIDDYGCVLLVNTLVKGQSFHLLPYHAITQGLRLAVYHGVLTVGDGWERYRVVRCMVGLHRICRF